MVTVLQKTDDAVSQTARVLSEFVKSHENAECVVYRYNPASIRVRIVDPVFHGRSKGERHDYAIPNSAKTARRRARTNLDPSLPPAGETSLLDLEFQDPMRSGL